MSVTQPSGRGQLAAKGMLWSMAQSVLGLVVTLLVFVVTSRILERSDFGSVAFATTLMTFGLALAPVAYNEAIVQIQDLEDADLDSLFSASVVVGLVLYAICCGLGFLLQNRMGYPNLGLLTAIISLRVLFESACVVPIGVLQRQMQFRPLALRQFAGSVIGNLLCLGLALAGAGLWALVANNVVASAASALVVLMTSDWRPRSLGAVSRLGRFIRYGSFAMGSKAMIVLRVDQFVIGLFQSMSSLGAFYLANRIVEICSQVCWTGLSPVSHSLLSRVRGDQERLQTGFLTSVFVAAALSFPLFVGIIYVAPVAIDTVFGDKWDAAVPLLRALSLTGLMGGIGAIQGALIGSQGYPGTWFTIRAVTLAGRVLGLLAVMPFWGLEAGVWAYVLGGLLVFPFASRMSLKLAGVTWRAYAVNLAAPAGASAAMVLALWLLDRQFSAGHAPLAASVALGVAVYVAVFGLGARKRILRLVKLLRARRGATAG